MKDKLTTIFKFAVAIAIGYLLYQEFTRTDDEWQRKIERHAAVADSLRNVVVEIDRRVYQRDSILVSYIATLKCYTGGT
ncbi:MAG TPA: hypothetical protein VD927_08595 [Chryseosolibacter sp.]|nr:hypothetical protein [Chryseosolibacter sp.]